MLQNTRCAQSLVPIACSADGSTAFSPLRTLPFRGHRSGPLSLRLPLERRQTFCQAEAQTPKEPTSVDSVLDYALGQGTYQLLSAALAVMAVSFLFAAPAVAEKMYKMTLLPVAEAIVRDTGALALIPAAMSFSLQSAVESNRTDSPTYKRMSFTLAFAMLATFIIKMIYVSKSVIVSAPGVWIASVVQVLPTVAFLKLYGLSTVPDIIPGFISGLKSLFEPDNINSALYSLFSVVTMILSLGAIIKPTVFAAMFFPDPIGVATKFSLQQMGAALFLLSIVCFTLKDSADRDRLGFTTFRNLNIAACLTSIGKAGALLFVNNKVVQAAADAAVASTSKGAKAAVDAAPASLLTKNGFIAIMTIVAGLALLTGYNAITAKKE